MALSSNTGGVSAASTAWTTSVSSNTSSGLSGGGSTGCADGCCPSTGPRINIASVLNQGNVRGELSGDNCFCVELGEDKVCGAVWSETEFTSSNIRTAISAAVGISPDGNKLLVEGVHRDDDLNGIIFGVDAERVAQKNQDIDVVYPTQLLSQQSPSVEFTIPESEEQLIDLPKSSDPSNMVSIYPEQALSLILLHWYHKTRNAKTDAPSTGDLKKKKKRGKRAGNLVTLVLPGYCGVYERTLAIKGAHAASMEVRNVFSRGLAVTAAALTHPTQSSSFYSLLQTWMHKRENDCCDAKDCGTSQCDASQVSVDPVVLFVHTCAGGIEVSLIRCERPRVQARPPTHTHDDCSHQGSKLGKGTPSNLMGFDRLVCLASGGGPWENMALGTL